MLRKGTLCILGILGLMLAAVAWAQTPGPLKLPESKPASTPPPAQAAPEPAAEEQPAHPIPLPCVADPQDPGPPKLERRAPGAERAERKPPPECETMPSMPSILGRPPDPERAPAPPPVATANLTLIERVRLHAQDYTQELPDFVCSQLIRRFQSRILRKMFKLKDTVTVDVAYVRGKEDYTNAKLNGKAISWDRVKWSGTFSEGEYGTLLRDLLSPATNAEFRLRGKEQFMGVATEVYEYTVLQPNSHWTLKYEAAEMKPAYVGRVWIDPKEELVRRIEMEARDLPGTFPVDQAEMTLDYGPVRIAERKYVLPVRTENLACFRTAAVCVRNETEFRNYRKFTAESTVMTTESTVTFEGETKKETKKKK